MGLPSGDGFALASEGCETLQLEARMVLYLSQIYFSRQTMEVAISTGSVPRVNLLLRQFPPLLNLSSPPLKHLLFLQCNGHFEISPLDEDKSVTFFALILSLCFPLCTSPRSRSFHSLSSHHHHDHTQPQQSSPQECFQQMPLPFTGLQAFHWGDGAKGLFLYAILVVVVIGDDAVNGG